MFYFMGVELADHVIVSKTGEYFSFRSENLINKYMGEVMKYLNLFDNKWKS